LYHQTDTQIYQSCFITVVSSEQLVSWLKTDQFFSKLDLSGSASQRRQTIVTLQSFNQGNSYTQPDPKERDAIKTALCSYSLRTQRRLLRERRKHFGIFSAICCIKPSRPRSSPRTRRSPNKRWKDRRLSRRIVSKNDRRRLTIDSRNRVCGSASDNESTG
jgi:hypothetical protein